MEDALLFARVGRREQASGASYTAQGLQKQPEILNNLLYISSTINQNLDFGACISVSKPLEPVLGRKFHIESEFEVQISY